MIFSRQRQISFRLPQPIVARDLAMCGLAVTPDRAALNDFRRETL